MAPSVAFLPSAPVVPRAFGLAGRSPRGPRCRAERWSAARRSPPCAALPAFGHAGKLRYDPRSGLHVVDVPGLSNPRRPVLLLLALAYAAFRLARRWAMRRLVSRRYERADLNGDIARFYDYRSAAWEAVWGEHLHHGLYFGAGGRGDRPLRGRAAQVETMRELLRIGGLDGAPSVAGAAGGAPQAILDVGCGIGGASRFLARAHETARVTGITLSPVQARRATELNVEAGLDGRVENVVCDAMQMAFADDSFDIVWSLESAEHMADKHRLVAECMRVLKPGGTLVMLAWCLRESTPRLRLSERAAIRGIQREYCLPRLAPPSEYQNIMRRVGLRHVKHEDWTARAAPFWREVALTAVASRKGWATLRQYGWPLVRSALAMRHVMSAIRQGTFELAGMTARKPTVAEAAGEAERMARWKGGCTSGG
jgi:tocopherol O-methyltransferase